MEDNLEIKNEIPILSVVVSVYHVFIFLICGISIFKAIDHSCFLHNYENIILIVSFGLVGGATNASRLVVRAVRYGNYKKNRLLWQVLTPIHGAVLSCVGYVVLRGGLLSLTTGTLTTGSCVNEDVYRYFIMGFSFLCGFASELFIKKLNRSAESLFGETDDVKKNNKP